METKLELKRKAFEYILYKMALWYIEINKIKSTDEFNHKNDFTVGKMRLLPFLVCMASSDRATILTLFDSFLASRRCGILEKHLIDYPFGKIVHIIGLRLAKPGKFNYLDDKVETFLEGNAFSFENRQISLSRKDFYTEGVQYELIDQAIEQLKKCNENFVNHDIGLMTFYSKRHMCWKVYHLFDRSQSEAIPFKTLLEEKSYYSTDPKLLLWV